jgi:hypothetical protein
MVILATDSDRRKSRPAMEQRQDTGNKATDVTDACGRPHGGA